MSHNYTKSADITFSGVLCVSRNRNSYYLESRPIIEIGKTAKALSIAYNTV